MKVIPMRVPFPIDGPRAIERAVAWLKAQIVSYLVMEGLDAEEADQIANEIADTALQQMTEQSERLEEGQEESGRLVADLMPEPKPKFSIPNEIKLPKRGNLNN